jgi:hypothetical protein
METTVNLPAKYIAARKALMEAHSIDEVKNVHDQAMAMRVYATQAKNFELEGFAIEMRKRAERRLGEMIAVMPKAKPPGINQYTTPEDRGIRYPEAPATLAEAGIDKNLAKSARKAANMSGSEFEAEIEKIKTKVMPRPPRCKKRPETDRAREVVRPIVESGQPISRKKLSEEHGLSVSAIQRAAAAEQVRIETELQIKPDDLSMSARDKLDAAIRQHKHKLDQEFESRVQAEGRKRLEETILPMLNKRRAEYDAVIKSRKGIMPRSVFRKILAALHPDEGASKKMREETFQIFKDLELVLVSEKELPTNGTDMPRTYEEMMNFKAQTHAKRREKRNHSELTA